MQDDTIICPTCNNKVLQKCQDIHLVACQQRNMRIKNRMNSKSNKKQKGFFSNWFGGSGQCQRRQQQQAMIPCTQCGQSFPFSMFALHQEQCVGHQLTKCHQCHILFPTFLFDEHLQVCTGKKVQKNQNKNNELMIEMQEQYSDLEDVDEQQRELMLEMIGELAIKDVKKHQFTDKPLTQDQVKNLKKIKLKKQEECAICCCPMMKVNMQVELPCRHVYHNKCISPWLKKNPHCPMCRRHCLDY